MNIFWKSFFEQKGDEPFMLKVIPGFLPEFWKRLFEFFMVPENWEFPSQWNHERSFLCMNPDSPDLYMEMEGTVRVESRNRFYPQYGGNHFPEWQFGKIYSLEIGTIACLKSNRGADLTSQPKKRNLSVTRNEVAVGFLGWGRPTRSPHRRIVA